MDPWQKTGAPESHRHPSELERVRWEIWQMERRILEAIERKLAPDDEKALAALEKKLESVARKFERLDAKNPI
jgi:hypothetical protein